MLESIFGHVGSKIGADIKVRALRTIRILSRCSQGPGETGLTRWLMNDDCILDVGISSGISRRFRLPLDKI